MGARRGGLGLGLALGLALCLAFAQATEDEAADHGGDHGGAADHGAGHTDGGHAGDVVEGGPAPAPSPMYSAASESSNLAAQCPALAPYMAEPSPFGWPLAPADWKWDREDCWPQKYAMCAGKLQSPMDIDLKMDEHVCPLMTRGANGVIGQNSEYRSQSLLAAQVSHYMGTAMARGNFGHLDLADGRYEAVQVHIASPSLHRINDTRYDAELMVVHRPEGAIHALDKAVIVSTLFQHTASGESKVFSGFGFSAKGTVDENQPTWDTGAVNVPGDMQAPLQGPAYMYNGSVPAPPCTENVKWIILGDVQPIGEVQTRKLKSMLEHQVPGIQYRPSRSRQSTPSECRAIDVNSLVVGSAHEDSSCEAMVAAGTAHRTARCWDALDRCFSKPYSAANIDTTAALREGSGEAPPLADWMRYKPVTNLQVRPSETELHASVPNHGDMGHLLLKGHIFFAHNISIKPISAHTINGVRHEAEILIEHVMYGDTYGQGLPGYIPDPHMVIASFQVIKGRHNELLADLGVGDSSNEMAIRDGTHYDVEERVDLSQLLQPALGGSWYWYSSNSTHPGCGNSIRWMVFETPLEASMEQLNALHLKISGVDSAQMAKPIPSGFLFKNHFPAFAVEANETSCDNLPMTEWAYGDERPLWTYGNERCWNNIYPTCGSGTSQSPIDIPGDVSFEGTDSFLSRISWYPVAGLRVSNTGHNVQVSNGQMGYTEFVGENGMPDYYQVVQFHLHMPSEHMINGKQYAAELHVVHKLQYAVGDLAADDLLVTGIMFDLGPQESPFLKQVFLGHMANGTDHIHHEGQYSTLPHPLDLARALGPALDGPFYRYSGGLTTPPCSEVVKWFVFETPLSMTEAQWLKFKNLYPNPSNNRPIQALNGRTVAKNSMQEGARVDFRFFLGRDTAHNRRQPDVEKILVPIVGTVLLAIAVMLSMWVREDSTRKRQSQGGLTATTIGRQTYTQLADRTPGGRA